MRNLANYITASRIVLSLLMLFTEALSPAFFMIFIICGLSDVADGYLAKNMGFKSDIGAKLDSFADIVFFLSFLIVLLPVLKLNAIIILWILVIFVIRMISVCISYMKFNELAFIHSYLNKLTGALLILLPFFLLLTSPEMILNIICLVATLASLEELIIVLRSRYLNPDCSGLIDFLG